MLVIHGRPPGYNITGYSSFYVIVTFKVLSDMLDTILEFTSKRSWIFFLFCFRFAWQDHLSDRAWIFAVIFLFVWYGFFESHIVIRFMLYARGTEIKTPQQGNVVWYDEIEQGLDPGFGIY